jgi:hypothetical protein
MFEKGGTFPLFCDCFNTLLVLKLMYPFHQEQIRKWHGIIVHGGQNCFYALSEGLYLELLLLRVLYGCIWCDELKHIGADMNFAWPRRNCGNGAKATSVHF